MSAKMMGRPDIPVILLDNYLLIMNEPPKSHISM